MSRLLAGERQTKTRNNLPNDSINRRGKDPACFFIPAKTGRRTSPARCKVIEERELNCLNSFALQAQKPDTYSIRIPEQRSVFLLEFGLLYDLLDQMPRHHVIMRQLHRVDATPLRNGP